MLINSTSKLVEACEKLSKDQPKFIAVDTEFIRNNNHYYPRLSLIQIFHKNTTFIVDVLSKDTDISPIEKIFYNPNIIKIFHDCRQDIETLLTRFSKVPKPIFDTQIAAMFCEHYENSIGYSKLVEKFFTGVILNKVAFKNTDWSKRPLSQEQLDYAYYDVNYLYGLYEPLKAILINDNKFQWFMEEMENITDINIYKINPEDTWKHLYTFNESMDKASISIINSLLELREIIAQKLNMNRNTIISNQGIHSLCNKILISNNPNIIYNYIQKSLLSQISINFVDIIKKNQNRQIKSKSVIKTTYNKSILNILLILLYNTCTKNNLSQKLVASQNDLLEIINGETNNLMKGWRYEFFGHYVESFIKGKLKVLASAEKLKNGKIEVDTTTIFHN